MSSKIKFSRKKLIEDGYAVFDFNKRLVANTKKKIFTLVENVIKKKYNVNINVSEKKIIKLYNSKYKTDIINIFNHIGFFSELFSFSCEKQILEIVKKAGLRFPVVGFNNIGGRGGLPFIYSFPNEKKRYYQAHQDFFYLPYSQNSITLWVPLQNTSKINGALKVIPKSHKNFKLYKHSASDVKHNKLDKFFSKNDYKTVNVKLGQALIFSSFLVHKTGGNASNQIRMSFNVRYNDLLDKEYITRGLSFDKFPEKKFKKI
jgi:phytanoyl-CoA hydroxylase